MKKITLLIALVFTSSLMFGQIVLTEDFEAGLALPAGWTNNDIAGNGEIWTFETGGEAGGFAAGNTFLYDPAGCVGNYATFNSDGYGDNGLAEEATLASPVFDCSTLTSVSLNFNMLFAGDFGGSGFVETSTDGTTWTTVETYTGDGNNFGLKTIDLTAQLAGQATSQIRFRWTGDWSISWTVDTISVFQCTETAGPAAVSAPTPADGAMNVAISAVDNGLDFSWTEGGPADSFTLNLDTANPPVANSFEGFANGGRITGLAENTQYFWSVDAVNCFGTTPGAVYSFTTGLALSVEENEFEGFSIYPNPTSNILNINSSKDIDKIEVFNLLGQNVASYKTIDPNNKFIDISNLSKGMYLVKISSGDKSETISVLKN